MQPLEEQLALAHSYTLLPALHAQPMGRPCSPILPASMHPPPASQLCQLVVSESDASQLQHCIPSGMPLSAIPPGMQRALAHQPWALHPVHSTHASHSTHSSPSVHSSLSTQLPHAEPMQPHSPATEQQETVAHAQPPVMGGLAVPAVQKHGWPFWPFPWGGRPALTEVSHGAVSHAVVSQTVPCQPQPGALSFLHQLPAPNPPQLQHACMLSSAHGTTANCMAPCSEQPLSDLASLFLPFAAAQHRSSSSGGSNVPSLPAAAPQHSSSMHLPPTPPTPSSQPIPILSHVLCAHALPDAFDPSTPPPSALQLQRTTSLTGPTAPTADSAGHTTDAFVAKSAPGSAPSSMLYEPTAPPAALPEQASTQAQHPATLSCSSMQAQLQDQLPKPSACAPHALHMPQLPPRPRRLFGFLRRWVQHHLHWQLFSISVGAQIYS